MKYLGVDFGLRKIGLALSEGELSSPFKIIHINSLNEGIKKIEEIIEKEKIEKVVIGLPDSGVRAAILKVVSKLSKKYVVVTTDETLSSIGAQSTMLNLGLGKKQRREEDAYSAAQILQDYLDNEKV